jgi:hypothetical protein
MLNGIVICIFRIVFDGLFVRREEICDCPSVGVDAVSFLARLQLKARELTLLEEIRLPVLSFC